MPCGKCANSLTTNHSAFRYECAACAWASTPRACRTRTRGRAGRRREEAPEERRRGGGGRRRAAGGARGAAAQDRHPRMCRNAEWTDDGGAPGAAREPWVPAARALRRPAARAGDQRRDDRDRAAGAATSTGRTSSTCRSTARQRACPLAGCIKKVRCDTCRSATPALRKACMLCRGSARSPTIKPLRARVRAELHGRRAPSSPSTRRTSATCRATSVRTPPGTAPSEGYARVEASRASGAAARAARSRRRRCAAAPREVARQEGRRRGDARAIETFIRETWPTKYHSLTVTRAFVTGARSAIVNVTGEGSTYCHHKHGEHTSNNIFFQILHAPPSSARIFQRCFSHRVIGNVRCRDWNARGADAKKIELPPEVAATLFGTYSMPTAAIATGGGGAQEGDDDGDAPNKGRAAKADGKPRKRGSSRQHRAKVKALGGSWHPCTASCAMGTRREGNACARWAARSCGCAPRGSRCRRRRRRSKNGSRRGGGARTTPARGRRSEGGGSRNRRRSVAAGSGFRSR